MVILTSSPPLTRNGAAELVTALRLVHTFILWGSHICSVNSNQHLHGQFAGMLVNTKGKAVDRQRAHMCSRALFDCDCGLQGEVNLKNFKI